MPERNSSTSHAPFERRRNGGCSYQSRDPQPIIRRTTTDSSPSLFREVNERIAELTNSAEITVGLFICECRSKACADTLEVTFAEYEAIRAHGDRFVVLAGHEHPELERVVEGNARFLVVERIDEPGEVAREPIPREQ